MADSLDRLERILMRCEEEDRRNRPRERKQHKEQMKRLHEMLKRREDAITRSEQMTARLDADESPRKDPPSSESPYQT